MNWPDDYLIPGIEPYHMEEAGIIYCGDCRDILPHLPKVDLVLTDPPYGVGFRYDGYEDSEENYVTNILPIIKQLSDNSMAVFGAMRHISKLPAFKWVLCWNKPGSTRRNAIGGFSIWEPIFIYGNNWKVANDSIRLPDCVNHDKDNNHPCPKPIKLFKWLLSLNQSDIILDPFLGSGTTAVAAKELGRKFIGIEISEEYCAIAVKRLRQGVLNFG